MEAREPTYKATCNLQTDASGYATCNFTITCGGNLLIEGRLKWDGCIDWRLESEHYAHFCQRSDVAELATAFDAVKDWADENWPDYEGD